MQPVVSALALLLLLVGTSSAQDGGYDGSSSSNYYILDVQICNGQGSIHGLWPVQENCGGAAFSTSSLTATTLSQMQQYWTSCAGSMTNEQFWTHEWEKHGSCTGMTQEAYFSQALSLFLNAGGPSAFSSGTQLCYTNSFVSETCPSSSSPSSSYSYSPSSSYYAVAQEGEDTQAASASSLSQAQIAGIAGGVCGVFVLSVVGVLVARRRQRAQQAATDMDNKFVELI